GLAMGTTLRLPPRLRLTTCIDGPKDMVESFCSTAKAGRAWHTTRRGWRGPCGEYADPILESMLQITNFPRTSWYHDFYLLALQVPPDIQPSGLVTAKGAGERLVGGILNAADGRVPFCPRAHI